MVLIAALYKFAPIADPPALQASLLAQAERLGVRGVLLIAPEGVNGTLAAEESALRAFLDVLRADPRLGDLGWKESRATRPPFRTLRVRLKKEIVSMGAPGVASPETVGRYAPPERWNALIARPELPVIDVRNAYETAIGRFEGAVDPRTERFRDFPAWADQWLETDPAARAAPEFAMYCTGGIRCEKASAYLQKASGRPVHHLQGGILAYLEAVPAAASLWRGGCFVFDERVSVGHDLAPDGHTLCRGCRRALSAEDRRHPDYLEGVVCGACAAEASDAQIAARRERRRQIALAAARGESHLGRAKRAV